MNLLNQVWRIVFATLFVHCIVLAASNELNEYVDTYRQRAEAGIPEDEYNLGASYRWGIDVPKDESLAVLWITKAAEKGYPLAERTLGDMYLNGEGVTQSDAAAMAWYKKAARQGDPLAAEGVAALEAKIHPVH